MFLFVCILLWTSPVATVASATFDHSPGDSTKQFYNNHVEEYIANIQKAGITHVPKDHSKKFIRLVKQNASHLKNKDANILEIGCGYGRDAEFFSKRGMNVLGTDYSRSMLLKAQERVPNAHFLELDMRQIANHLLPNSFDGIWACATIIHIPKEDVPALLQSMYEILRPGGVLYVSVKQGQGEQFDADERYGGIRKFYAFYGKEELLEYFAKAGFDIVESGVADHREKDSYATHPFIHVFAIKPKK